MSDIVARLRDGIPSQSCDTDSVTFVRCGRGDCACEERLSKEAAAEIERLRAQILDGRRLLWLIVKSNDGYTLERADIESYPGDDMATIARTTDTATGDMTLSAVTNGDRGK